MSAPVAPTLEALLTQGPLGVRTAQQMGMQVAEQVQRIHDGGRLHGDLQSRLVACEDGGRFVLLPASVAPAGTERSRRAARAAYVSPEEAAEKPATQVSEVYSVAVLVFEALMGRPPFRGHTDNATLYMHVNDAVPWDDVDLPPEVVHVLTRALAKHPRDRHPTCEAFHRELLSWSEMSDDASRKTGDSTSTATITAEGRTRSTALRPMSFGGVVRALVFFGILFAIALGVVALVRQPVHMNPQASPTPGPASSLAASPSATPRSTRSPLPRSPATPSPRPCPSQPTALLLGDALQRGYDALSRHDLAEALCAFDTAVTAPDTNGDVPMLVAKQLDPRASSALSSERPLTDFDMARIQAAARYYSRAADREEACRRLRDLHNAVGVRCHVCRLDLEGAGVTLQCVPEIGGA